MIASEREKLPRSVISILLYVVVAMVAAAASDADAECCCQLVCSRDGMAQT